ncbi:hypothetical protein ACFHW0_30020 [Micromonospora sp. LOL_025]|uniref:hypothetical protein n=1 Tax=Micromonospora sp. LOL_025 TaxID=3345413 RepID=UPI003A8C599C
MIPDSVTDAELSTVQFLAVAMGRVPRQPVCSGPLLVHADGAFECHGDGCPGETVVFHHEDIIDPCSRQPQIQTGHACQRCVAHSENAALIGPSCTGVEIEHDDGTTECSEGDACVGADELHGSGRSCRVFGPCPRDCQPAADAD